MRLMAVLQLIAILWLAAGGFPAARGRAAAMLRPTAVLWLMAAQSFNVLLGIHLFKFLFPSTLPPLPFLALHPLVHAAADHRACS